MLGWIWAFPVALFVSAAVAQPVEQRDALSSFDAEVERGRAAVMTGAYLQTDLERIAASRDRSGWEYPAHLAWASEVPKAYAAFLSDDPANMDMHLSAARRGALDLAEQADADRSWAGDYGAKERVERDAERARLEVLGHHPDALIRLLATVRLVDHVLFGEASSWTLADTARRTVFVGLRYAPSRLEGFWLRLPCRTVKGRAQAFTDAQRTLGESFGPLLACPAQSSDPTELERLAADPRRWPAAGARKPWSVMILDRENQVRTPMAERERPDLLMRRDPDRAERLLRERGDPIQLALFLHAFREPSAERDAEIDHLTQSVADMVRVDAGYILDRPPVDSADPSSGRWRYDGTEESLVDLLVAPSYGSRFGNGLDDIDLSSIPCAVLLRRPALLDATEAQHGSNRDNFLPRDGCDLEATRQLGFPWKQHEAYVNAIAPASGYFMDYFDGSMKFGYGANENSVEARIKLDPHWLLTRPDVPPFETPYQSWALLGPYNWQVFLEIKQTADGFRRALMRYYVAEFHLSRHEARRAATQALFVSAYGPSCGAAAGMTLRAMTLSNRPPREIAAWRKVHGDAEDSALDDCARFAGRDPLLHLAALRPRLLPDFIATSADVDARNAIGKTPLMVAAQSNVLDSARRLLAARADVNARTSFSWTPWLEPALAHDGRTPLMYAAASGSLSMIRLLLRHGADVTAVDTKGRRAIDYLLGFGPVAANPRLSERQRAEAASLLF